MERSSRDVQLASYRKRNARFRFFLFLLMFGLIAGPGRYTLGAAEKLTAPLPAGSQLTYTIITGILVLLALPFYVREAVRLDRLKAELRVPESD